MFGLLGGALLGPAEGAERIKIAVTGLSTEFAPLYHAQSAGYFAEEGLEVEVVAIAGAGSLQAVLAREVQFTVSPGTYQLMLYKQGWAARRASRRPAGRWPARRSPTA